MTGIITGDIINSREVPPTEWLEPLKDTLGKYGKEPAAWEIYRGDSFQLEVSPAQALEAALLLKTSIKQFNQLDVRLAIGIGDKTYPAKKIKEANGSAFINSGECFESLKKNTIGIKTPWPCFNIQMNIMLQLSALTMDNWSPEYSKIMQASLEFPNKTQRELADMLNKTQSIISEGLKRVGHDEIVKMTTYYINQ